jgi:chromosome segregation ATPase
VDRKARQARRAQAFNRRPGRTPGVVPLIKDPKRFEYALWFFLTNTLGYPTLKAAKIAAAFLDNRSPVTTLTDRTGISALYQGGRESETALDHRAKYLIKHADENISRADEQSRNWLAQSAGALHAVFTFVAASNAGGVSVAIEILDRLGWKKKLARILRVAAIPKN